MDTNLRDRYIKKKFKDQYEKSFQVHRPIYILNLTETNILSRKTNLYNEY